MTDPEITPLTVYVVHTTDPYEYGSGHVEGVYSTRAAADQHADYKKWADATVEKWAVRDHFDPTYPAYSLD